MPDTINQLPPAAHHFNGFGGENNVYENSSFGVIGDDTSLIDQMLFNSVSE